MIGEEEQVAAATPAQPVAEHHVGRGPRTYWRTSWDRLARDPVAMAGAVVIAFFAVVALAAPLIAAHITHYDPSAQDLNHTFSPPSSLHWLGSDDLGRDTATRIAYGARVTLGVALLTVVMALTIGTVVGLLAGFNGGWIDELLMRLVDVIIAVPPIFFFLLMAILFRPGPVALAVIVASISWVSSARLVRSDVLSIKNRDFILATKSVGASGNRLVARHLFPNVLPIVLVAASLGIGQVILIEAALDFLGFGIQPPTPSWGNMVVALQIFFTRAVWVATFPGLCIFATVLAANVLGNALRDALDPTLR